jgi:hypothetical protein
MAVEIRWQEEHLDWQPLEAVVGVEGAGDWMWMHACECPDTGETVHFYKHVWSRRYLRLDAKGRAYRESRDGEPLLLPACGGGTLLLQLLLACAHVASGLPPTITVPEAAREPCTVDDLPVLDALAVHASSEYRRILETLNAAPAAIAAHGRAPATR